MFVLRDGQESCLADLAVIVSKFLIPYRGVGILAIIGPANLDYQQPNQSSQCGQPCFDHEVDEILPLPQQSLRSTLRLKSLKEANMAQDIKMKSRRSSRRKL